MSRPTLNTRFTEVFTLEDVAGLHPLEAQIKRDAEDLEGYVAIARRVITATQDNDAAHGVRTAAWHARVRSSFLATMHVRWTDRAIDLRAAVPNALAALALALAELGA